MITHYLTYKIIRNAPFLLPTFILLSSYIFLSIVIYTYDTTAEIADSESDEVMYSWETVRYGTTQCVIRWMRDYGYPEGLARTNLGVYPYLRLVLLEQR
jgi:hypothetical protein